MFSCWGQEKISCNQNHKDLRWHVAVWGHSHVEWMGLEVLDGLTQLYGLKLFTCASSFCTEKATLLCILHFRKARHWSDTYRVKGRSFLSSWRGNMMDLWVFWAFFCVWFIALFLHSSSKYFFLKSQVKLILLVKKSLSPLWWILKTK